MAHYAWEQDRVPADRQRVADAGHGIFTVECCGESVDSRHGDVVDVAFGASYPLAELIEFGVHVTIRNTGVEDWLGSLRVTSTVSARRHRDHSTFAPDSLTAFAHLARSDWMNAVNSRGVLPTTSTPSRESRSRSFGSFKVLTISVFKRATIACGV